MGLLDMNNTQQDAESPQIPGATPEPALPAAPSGGPGWGSALLNALAVGLAGFTPTASGFQGRVFDQVARNQERQRQMELMSGIGQSVAEVNAHATNGDLDKANAAYRNLLRMPGAAGMPQVWALGKDLQDRALALQQRRGLAAILGQPRSQQITIPGTGTPAVPGTTETTEGEQEQPSGNAERVGPASAPVPAPASASDMLRSRMLPGQVPQAVQPTGVAPDATLGNAPSITTATPGTAATPDRTALVDMRPKILQDLVASGQMKAEEADKLLYPAPQIIDGPLGSKWAYDHRADTMKLLTPGTTELTPGKTVSLVDFAKLGANGQPSVTPIASGGLAIPSTLQERALPSEQALYQRATQTGDYATADALTSKWQQAHFAAQVPDTQKSYLQRAGATQADMAAMASGDNSPRIVGLRDRAARISIQDEEVKKADELVRANQIQMSTQPASHVFQGYKSYVDDKGNIVEAGALSGQQARDGLKDGKLFGLSADQDNRYRMMNNLEPQLATARANLPRLFAGVTPGTNLGNALALKAKELGGDGAVRLQNSLNIDISAEQTRILAGTSRAPVSMFNKYMEEGGGTASKTDTAESALARQEFAVNVTKSAKLNLATGTGLKTLDPYATSPILRDLQALRQQGHNPVLSVDRQGSWTIVDHK